MQPWESSCFVCFYSDWTQSPCFCQIDGSLIGIPTLKSDIWLHISVKCVQMSFTSWKYEFKSICPTEMFFCLSQRWQQGCWVSNSCPTGCMEECEITSQKHSIPLIPHTFMYLNNESIASERKSLKGDVWLLLLLCLVKRRKADSM